MTAPGDCSARTEIGCPDVDPSPNPKSYTQGGKRFHRSLLCRSPMDNLFPVSFKLTAMRTDSP